MELNERDIDLQKEAPTLSAIGRAIPFTVPAGYFEELPVIVNSRVYIETVYLNGTGGFSVPEKYFEELPSRIESSIAFENIKAAVPAEGFTLPDAYFEGLSARINQRLELPSESKTPVRRILTSWVGYAAAACITAMIAAGIYFNTDSYNFNKQLSELSEQEIINYLQVHSTAGDTPFIIENLNPDELNQVSSDVSADDLEQYINSTTL